MDRDASPGLLRPTNDHAHSCDTERPEVAASQGREEAMRSVWERIRGWFSGRFDEEARKNRKIAKAQEKASVQAARYRADRQGGSGGGSGAP